MLITVLTPTYNRGYIIRKLYDSLKKQSNKSFEWIVVDDGSTDNTNEIFKEILAENKLNIKYIQKLNGGKHTALNVGIKHANGEMVLIVDSDDYLSNHAIERVICEGKKIFLDEKFSGVSFRKIGIKSNEIIGTKGNNENFIDTNNINRNYKYGIGGDMAECFKLSILREFPFPIYKNEKFVPESLIWNRIGTKYKMRFFINEGIYYCEYLEDGYSQQFERLRKENTEAYKNYYFEEMSNLDTPIKRKIKCFIGYLYIRIKKCGL